MMVKIPVRRMGLLADVNAPKGPALTPLRGSVTSFPLEAEVPADLHVRTGSTGKVGHTA